MHRAKLFAAEMAHTFIDSFTFDTVRTSGKVWIGLNRYKMIIGERYILVDDSTSTVYDRLKNRIIISDYDPSDDDYAPSRFLSATSTEYNVSERRDRENRRNRRVDLTSADPFSIFSKVEIVLDGTQTPLQIKAEDQSKNLLISDFSQGSFAQPGSEVFKLNHPADVEVVDLRN